MDKEIGRAFSLEGSAAVITGAASGIGRETARVFAQAGARVVLGDIDQDGLAETIALVESAGGVAVAQRTNVALRAEVDALADYAMQSMSQLDAWINVAGVALQSPILETAEPEFDRVVAINMKGTYWGCAAAGRVMKAQGRGAIVNISSGGADLPLPGLSVYSMTKAAVNALTRTCAMEFGSFGVRVNAVAPGWTETPMGSQLFRNADGEIDPVLREQFLQRQAQASPLGQTGTPEDIALATLYLASDASRFVTGQVLHANGGTSM